ncbi:MAG: cysteine rich repeat-containing protein [Rhizomicrobium sp.]|jgi:hypothetical protein
MTRFTAAGFLLLLTCTGALAQTPPPPQTGTAPAHANAPATPGIAPGKQMLLPSRDAQSSQSAYLHQPVCMPDVKHFCSDVKLGHGRVRACLAAHRAQLAPLCQEKLAHFEKWLADRKAHPGGPIFHREGHSTPATSPAKSTAPQTGTAQQTKPQTPATTQQTTPPKQ